MRAGDGGERRLRHVCSAEEKAAGLEVREEREGTKWPRDVTASEHAREQMRAELGGGADRNATASRLEGRLGLNGRHQT